MLSENVKNENFKKFWNLYFLFEVYLTISAGTIKHGFCFPKISASNYILELSGLYHPSLKNPVRNSLIPKTNVALFTGPNMSGKSTFLKAVALCVYLGHLGFATPAENGKIPLFNSFYISINKDDDITNGYSHFMNEIVYLKVVIEAANSGERCFAVFDELFKGTNVEDAVNIFSITLEGLTKYSSSLFLISTHLSQLKNIAPIIKNHIDILYFESYIQDGRPFFKYSLQPGWSTLRLGEVLFKLVGLDTLLKK